MVALYCKVARFRSRAIRTYGPGVDGDRCAKPRQHFFLDVCCSRKRKGILVVGIETVDHPTDGQLVAYAKKYFKRVDRMQ